MPRLNLSISKKAEDRIETLLNNDMFEFNSKSDVIRASLALLDYMVSEEKNGNHLSVTKENKIVKDIILTV